MHGIGLDWLSTDILSVERDFCDQIFWIHSQKYHSDLFVFESYSAPFGQKVPLNNIQWWPNLVSPYSQSTAFPIGYMQLMPF